ncbi:MAG: 2Fe-2S iron-sulfur cluster binding domain-containing protein [Chromatiales bacterium]|jgi:ring-1,2-phenylacetyl-CoA epoxidase subunit PaaE|nr:2Fe-2S iron-sulfur cluster binding domain-containing protein [Chromatiales bacterium]
MTTHKATHFYPLRVTGVHQETRDSKVLTLEPAADIAERFMFVPGQYLTFKAQHDGQEIRRSYSICEAPGSGLLRVAVKKVAGGLVSTWVNEQLREGDTVDAMAPAGNFFADSNKAARRFLMVAAGSGITPIISIVTTLLESHPDTLVTLIYGNRASPTIMFREALEDLKNRFLGRLNLVHVLTREQQDVDLFNGRLDRQKCEELFRTWVDVSVMDAAYLCGPVAMMEAAKDVLIDCGMASEHIHREVFVVDGEPTARRWSANAAGKSGNASQGQCTVTVIMDGRTVEFDLNRGQETVLEAGERAGLEMPYSCRSGVCSTCCAKLVEGEVDMDANYALEDYEIERGYVLTCQSHPVSDALRVDYDQ